MATPPNLLGYQNPAVTNANLDTTTISTPEKTPPTVRENVQAYLPIDQQTLMNSLRQIGEVLLLLEKRLREPVVPVALADEHSIIPVAITDSSDVVGISSRPMRVDPVGTTTQPVNAPNPLPVFQTAIATILIQIGAALLSVQNPLPNQFSDGFTSYDLKGLDAILRGIRQQLFNIQNIQCLQAGAFIPVIEIPEFLS